MIHQVSIDELIPKEEPKIETEIPFARYDGEKVYTIPDDVWETRCQLCIHKTGEKNVPIPLWAVHKRQYETIIPCRIMSICRPNDHPGECMSFAPRMDVYGICATCEHNNTFHDGFCMKEDHAEQRRVFYGTHYGGDDRKIDYYSRHRLSVCDDYKPDEYAKRKEKQ